MVKEYYDISDILEATPYTGGKMAEYYDNSEIFGKNRTISRVRDMNGLKIGFINEANEMSGFQVGMANGVLDKGRGVQLGCVNTSWYMMKGLEVGLANIVNEMKGCQFGIFNYAREMKDGPQISPLFNYAKEGDNFRQIGLINKKSSDRWYKGIRPFYRGNKD